MPQSRAHRWETCLSFSCALRFSVLAACGIKDFARSVGIHRGNTKAYDQIGPSRLRESCDKSGCNDGDVCQRIISRGQEGGFGEAPAVMTVSGEHERTAQVN